ncbi:DEAD/DEAH box helicase [Candidatus Uhrbacteria bacterium]|nr:DEAD/DEAH box helicase [Candidatus Uhrbacteria bacterium]
MSTNSTGFGGLGLAPKLLETLEKNKFTEPTPIQAQAIPIAVQGQDVMGVAQTGTGKTLAFGLPMIQRLAVTKGRGLVILPTRELALQVDEIFQKIGRHLNLRTAVLIGGASVYHQKKDLARKPHILIATPGRLIDHLDQRSVNVSDVRVLVLDEADRMLDMGFEPQIQRILQTVPKERQTMLFSATMPDEIVDIAHRYMKSPTRVEIARAGTSAEKVEQEVIFVERNDKLRLLEKLLGEYKGTILVFSRTKHGATKICRAVRNMGHNAAEIHSDRTLAQRRKALDGFKSGEFRVLVATDIAARGIDVKGIELVLNYDLPDHYEDYVHRIGRTGRAGMEGKAISFASPDQRQDVKGIERLIRKVITVKHPGDLPAPRRMDFAPRPEYADRGPRKPYGQSRSDSYAKPRAPQADGSRFGAGIKAFDDSFLAKGKRGSKPSYGPKAHGGFSRADNRSQDKKFRRPPLDSIGSGSRVKIHT